MSQLMEKGAYANCNLKEWAFPEGKSGHVEIHLKFEIAENTFRTVYLYTTDAAWPFTSDKLKRLGWNGKTGEAAEFSDAQGVELYCDHDTYNGTTKEKWNIGGLGMKADAGTDKLRTIEARFRNEHRSPAPAPARSAPPARTATPQRSAPPPRTQAPVTKPFGKEDAWDAFEKGGVSSPDAFNGAIEATEKARNKTEAEFTADDWQYVCELKDIPF